MTENKPIILSTPEGVNYYLEQLYDTTLKDISYNKDGYAEVSEVIDINIPFKPIQSSGSSIMELSMLALLINHCDKFYQNDKHGFNFKLVEEISAGGKKLDENGEVYYDFHFPIDIDTKKEDIENLLDHIHTLGFHFIQKVNEYMGNISQEYLNNIISGDCFKKKEMKELINKQIEKYSWEDEPLTDLIPDIEDKIKTSMIDFCKNISAMSVREIIEDAYDTENKCLSCDKFFEQTLNRIDVEKMRSEALSHNIREDYLETGR